MGTTDVVLSELEWVAEGVVNVGLRSEVQNRVDVFRLYYVCSQIYWADVSFYKLEVRETSDGFQIFQVGAIVEFVKDNDLHARFQNEISVMEVWQEGKKIMK